MIYRAGLCLTAALVAVSPLQAQTGIIGGRVIAAESRQPVAGATVREIDGGVVATSDSAGRFRIVAAAGIRRLEVRRIGFAPVIRTDIAVSPGRAAEVEIALRVVPTALTAVVVRPSYFPASTESAYPVSTQSLSAEEIRRAPGVQEDVVRALSVFPGATITDPVANNVVVRGSASAENLYLVDGVEVPTLNHFSAPGSTAGVISLFPVALVGEATFSAGGFGVRYGDRTASVTDIVLREGSRERASTQATFSGTGIGLVAEGPVGAASSIIVGTRRSYYDVLFKILGLPFVPTYTDLTVKLVSRPTTRDRLTLFTVGGVDRISTSAADADDRYDVSRISVPRQDSYVAGFGWQRSYDRGVAEVVLGRTWSRFRVSQADSSNPPRDVFRVDADEGETSLRAFARYSPTARTELEAGNILKNASRLQYDVILPGALRRDASGTAAPLSVDTTFSAWRNASYAQATLRPAPRVAITLGGRVDAYPFLSAARFGPRAATTFELSRSHSVTLSAGRYWQAPPFAWLIGDQRNRQLVPIRADQVVVGLEQRIRPDLKVQFEGYVKRLGDYPARVFRPQSVLQPITADVTTDIPLGLEPLEPAGDGEAMGVEAFVQKRLSDTPYYAALSVSLNRTRFRGLDGQWRTGAFDVPVGVSGLAGWRPNARWELSGRLRVASGLPTTPFVESGPDIGAVDFTRYNGGPRLAPVVAIDIRVDRRWQFGTRNQLITYLDVQGVNGRQNETYPMFDQREQRVERQFFLGTFPSIGITWERGAR